MIVIEESSGIMVDTHDCFIPGMLLSCSFEPDLYFYPLLLSYFRTLYYMNNRYRQIAKTKSFPYNMQTARDLQRTQLVQSQQQSGPKQTQLQQTKTEKQLVTNGNNYRQREILYHAYTISHCKALQKHHIFGLPDNNV